MQFRATFPNFDTQMAIHVFPITHIEKSSLPQVDFDNLPFGKVFADHMFVAEYRDGHWQNARILPYGEIPTNPAISALHYGQSIFEGLKAYRDQQGNIRIFRPYDNMSRMIRSASRLCMPAVTEEIFIGGLKALLELDQEWVPRKAGYSLYMRPFMYAIDEYVGIRPSDSYRFIIFNCPVGNYYTAPLNVKVSDRYVRAFPMGTGFAKVAGNYAAGMLPLKHARKAGYDQLVWLDGKEMKYIEESGTMNLFFQVGNTLVTPIADGTILEGITRDSILGLAIEAGLPVEVRKISIDEVVAAYDRNELNDAFGTGTAASVAQISSITVQERRLELPPLESRIYSNSLGRMLDDIKTGKTQDTRGWIMNLT
jgi:branched-chain amino acid aminotransferase